MSPAIGTNKIILILILSAIVVTGVSIIVVFTTKDNKKRKIRFRHKEHNNLTVIKSNEEIVKPNVKLNAELELVKMKNGMTGLLISDNTATYSFIEITMNNGSFIDTDSGISHFGEHMILQGSEKYPPPFPIFNYLMGIEFLELNAMTSGILQVYYVKVPNDETLQSLFATYQRIMDGQNGETVYRNTVPPGVCADYGYMLILAGKTDEGKALLLKEKELYPESAVFIERVLEMVER